MTNNKRFGTKGWTPDLMKVQKGKTFLITGANSGTGFEASKILLSKGAKLLAPNASISETAFKLGFEYPQYFSRLFKRKTGLSPKEYIESASLN